MLVHWQPLLHLAKARAAAVLLQGGCLKVPAVKQLEQL